MGRAYGSSKPHASNLVERMVRSPAVQVKMIKAGKTIRTKKRAQEKAVPERKAETGVQI